ncbi:MAG: mechanosensitive ion channel family protein [Dehalococcoidia bacterium]|nr:mechanosensitive ion channel family protein [Dehalococcoidia bacterium]
MDELPFGLTRDEWLETALAAGIMVTVILVATLVAAVAGRIVHRFTRATESQLDDHIAAGVRTPFVLLAAIWALASGSGTLSYAQGHMAWMTRAGIALSVIVVAVAFRRVLVDLLEWQAGRPGAGGKLHPGSLPLVRRGITILVGASAVLIIMDTLGVAISPLLAGLGIGGLAVALALQPLLANVFASSYMLSDSSIRIGDWVEIQGGLQGQVDDIGWRATRVRTFSNNVVILPNATLAQSTVTNYTLSGMEADAYVTFGVAYEEDLDRVEQVAREVMQEVKDERPSALQSHTSVFSYTDFGESNVMALLEMRAVTWLDSYDIKHHLIKRLHARFAREGIRMNYPARRLLLEEQDAPALRLSARNGGLQEG